MKQLFQEESGQNTSPDTLTHTYTSFTLDKKTPKNIWPFFPMVMGSINI